MAAPSHATLASARHAYNPPQFDDVRSPCPALNALANHSYLPHNGKKIGVWQATKAIREVYGFSWLFAGLLAIAAGLWLGSGLSFSLTDLRKHNGIEHDGSLTRPDVDRPTDKYAPEHHDPAKLANFLGERKELTLEDLVAIRKARNDELVANGRPLNAFHNRLANGEVAFTFLTWANQEGKMATHDLKMWFGQDRLPNGNPGATRFHSFMKIRKTVDLVSSKLDSLSKTQ